MKNIEYDIPIFESNDLADLDLYSEKMATAIKGQIDKFGNPLAFKGIKQNISELDLISNAQSGDIYGVIETNKNYIWNGKEWIIYSDIMELDNYYNKEEINQKIENIQALPTGGTKGQVLTKQSETDGDANWEDIEANEVFVGNEEEAPNSAKIIIEDEDFEESSTLGKSEIYVGAEEPTTGEKVWFNKDENSIYVRNSNGVYEEFAKKSEEVYSTEEQVIGTWIDGKPLYRKVVEMGNMTKDNYKMKAHNIQNMKYARIVDVSMQRGNQSSGNFQLFSVGNVGGKYNDTQVGFDTYIDSNCVYVYCNGDRTLFVGTAIIEYTKTTD